MATEEKGLTRLTISFGAAVMLYLIYCLPMLLLQRIRMAPSMLRKGGANHPLSWKTGAATAVLLFLVVLLWYLRPQTRVDNVGSDSSGDSASLVHVSSIRRRDTGRIASDDVTTDDVDKATPASLPVISVDPTAPAPMKPIPKDNQRWLRLEGKHPLPHYLWVPLAPLLSGDPHVTESWGLLMYLHGAGESGDDLSLLIHKKGAMGTPPQIIEGNVLDEASSSSMSSDGAAASLSTHPLRNGTLSGSPFRTLVIAPQSNLMWPYDPHRLGQVAEWIRQLGESRGGRSVVQLAEYTIPAEDVAGQTLDSDALKSGASQGGYAVMEIVTRQDLIDTKAVFVALCGFSIDDDRIARDMVRRIDRNNNHNNNNRRPQLVLTHGRNDVVVPSLATSQVVQRIDEKNSRYLQVVRVPRGLSIGDVVQKPGNELKRPVVFFDLEASMDPLDAPLRAAGHAVWRDMFAATSPIWKWLQ